jgi:hypothetical protein
MPEIGMLRLWLGGTTFLCLGLLLLLFVTFHCFRFYGRLWLSLSLEKSQLHDLHSYVLFIGVAWIWSGENLFYLTTHDCVDGGGWRSRKGYAST